MARRPAIFRWAVGRWTVRVSTLGLEGWEDNYGCGGTNRWAISWRDLIDFCTLPEHERERIVEEAKRE